MTTWFRALIARLMERRLPAGRSAAFQAASRRQDAGGPAGKMPALRKRKRRRAVVLLR